MTARRSALGRGLGALIQSRDGTNLSTISLGAFWAPAGATGPFDPKTLYDPYENRWMTCAVDAARSTDSSMLDTSGASFSAELSINSTDTWVSAIMSSGTSGTCGVAGAPPPWL